MENNTSKNTGKSGGKEQELSGAELVNPYQADKPKGEQVERMFDSIAPAYDFMNAAMTFGLCGWWRNRALKAAGRRLAAAPADVLDIATGTGDVAFRLHDIYPESHITGVDLSDGMLSVARKKLSEMDASAQQLLSFEKGDSLHLGFPDCSFDLVTVAYGVRNFEHLRQGLAEMSRVLRPGGVLCVIELSVPQSGFLKWGYNLYSRNVIPLAGRLISGDSRAYSYLPESIAAAPQRAALTGIMECCGLEQPEWRSLTFGVVTYYTAIKKS